HDVEKRTVPEEEAPMSLRQYEYALAVAEHGSVTAAADELRVAQPSMSQQIRNLERDLGVTLFARTPSGLVPTVVGRAHRDLGLSQERAAHHGRHEPARGRGRGARGAPGAGGRAGRCGRPRR